MFASLLVMKVIAGAVVGGLAGLIGGAIGGVIDEYLAPLARLMNARDRLAWARGAAEFGARGGAFIGLLVGGTTGAVGGLVAPPVLLLAAGVLFWLAARLLERHAGESIVGLGGTFIGGAVFGGAGGYAGGYIATAIWTQL